MDYLYSFSGFVATAARMQNGARQDGSPGAPRWRAPFAYLAVTVTGTLSCAVKPLLSSATTFSA
ncbi:hypothetical protein CLU94_4981 [Janthinobacterium sp. 13]|nr:hypothetical protein CLU94_4981 [Janthinobacterium sp. 13]